MNGCPHHAVREGLPPLTPRIAKLPRDERGYPVPFFVKWISGKPEFQISDPSKLFACLKLGLCWCCGQQLGKHKAFVIGPVSSIMRTTSEPASHLDCLEWAARGGCPFLLNPNMVRKSVEKLRADVSQAGFMEQRNPGVLAIWVTRDFHVFNDGRGKPLITVGEPLAVTWYREGRAATRAEVLAAIDTGLPALRKLCRNEAARLEVDEKIGVAMKYLPGA